MQLDTSIATATAMPDLKHTDGDDAGDVDRAVIAVAHAWREANECRPDTVGDGEPGATLNVLTIPEH